MNILKRKAIAYFELVAANQGLVLDVRQWDTASIVEIDLHLPGVNMHKWQYVQHMKVRVAEGIYRDYTPAMYDAATSTCTLIIDTSHAGTGSSWARQLAKGDNITHVGVSATLHKPQPGANIICLGDVSAMGHLLALEYLAGKGGNVSGAIVMPSLQDAAEFNHYFHTSIVPVRANGADTYTPLAAWLGRQQLTDQTIYITGNNTLVSRLRKLIKQQDTFRGSVKAHGFWS